MLIEPPAATAIRNSCVRGVGYRVVVREDDLIS
jgi:hypothetical protein